MARTHRISQDELTALATQHATKAQQTTLTRLLDKDWVVAKVAGYAGCDQLIFMRREKLRLCILPSGETEVPEHSGADFRVKLPK